MPELPEVERAANLIKIHALGKSITKVETTEDAIVFSGATHTEFSKEIEGRNVLDVARYGKIFYILLDGKGRMPVLHFGMTGNILVKGEEPIYYKEGPKKGAPEWPPRFVKFILHLNGPAVSGEAIGKEDTETLIAFVDARRLGRIRLCADPLKEPPISTLGFDPLLCMPTLEEFSRNVLKRSCPIKALLLDQSFSAGVGNWVADEVLYHARIHPEQRCRTLSMDQINALFENIVYVCRTAVSVNADSSKFPKDWLFSYRWGKGKGKKKESNNLKLPSGQPATIKWLTVGGRTSAYVEELQHLSVKREENESVGTDDDNSELTALSELKNAIVKTSLPVTRQSRKRRRTSRT